MYIRSNLASRKVRLCEKQGYFSGSHSLVLSHTSVARAAAEWDYSIFVNQGRLLTQASVSELEQSLSRNPQDPAIRARLLGYYSNQYTPVARTARLQLLRWVIDNQPDSILLRNPIAPLGPNDIAAPNQAELGLFRDAWKIADQSHPGNARVLENSARSLEGVDLITASDYFLTVIAQALLECLVGIIPSCSA